MDELGSKLRKLFKPKPKVFKGKGNILGRADQVPSSSTAQASAAPRPRLQPVSDAKPQGIPPGRRLGTSSEAAAATGRAQGQGPNGAPSSTPPVREVDQSLPAALPDVEGVEDLDHAVALLQSSGKADVASEILGKLLRNILAEPTQGKYRRLRLSNKRIQESIIDVDGGVEVLQACGFELVFEEAEDGGQSEGFAVLPEHSELTLLQAALQLLGQAPAPVRPQPLGDASAASSSGAAAVRATQRATQPEPQPRPAETISAPRPRNTQVLLPVQSAGDQPLPSWFFERSPSELKAAFTAKQKQRELDQTLMTRAYREKLNGQKQSVGNFTYTTVRIRLPEGLVLQGEFSAGEPVAAVYEWLTDSLRDPGCTYELIGPDRQPITPAKGSLKKANLVPTALLNFQRRSAAPQIEPTLKDEVLRLAS